MARYNEQNVYIHEWHASLPLNIHLNAYKDVNTHGTPLTHFYPCLTGTSNTNKELTEKKTALTLPPSIHHTQAHTHTFFFSHKQQRESQTTISKQERYERQKKEENTYENSH